MDSQSLNEIDQFLADQGEMLRGHWEDRQRELQQMIDLFRDSLEPREQAWEHLQPKLNCPAKTAAPDMSEPLKAFFERQNFRRKVRRIAVLRHLFDVNITRLCLKDVPVPDLVLLEQSIEMGNLPYAAPTAETSAPETPKPMPAPVFKPVQPVQPEQPLPQPAPSILRPTF